MRRFLLRVLGGLLLASVLAVVAYRFVDPPLTPLMVIRAAETRSPRWARQWVPLGAVSPALLRAVLAAEDARFLAHHGVDWPALERAREYNERWRGRRLRGAGTITMQCARTVYLWPGRSYVRKALEVYLAWLLELGWGKRRILEVYVNTVEWGDGVYGAEAAARRYFGVPAGGWTRGSRRSSPRRCPTRDAGARRRRRLTSASGHRSSRRVRSVSGWTG